MAKDIIIKVTIIVEDDGVTLFVDEKGTPLALRLPTGGVCNLRIEPPWYPLIPCPYCLTDNDRKHSIADHTHPFHGWARMGE